MKKYKSNHAIVSERFAKIFALLIILIGLVILIGWYSGLMFLTRFSSNEVAMAPSTAYIFIGLAVGIWFYLRPQKKAISRNATIFCAGIVICLSCVFLVTKLFKYDADWEHVLITIPESQLSMELGHMSLVTAILFIISGLALLFLLSNGKILKSFSIILMLIIFIISFILLLGYGFGAPFFYFDSFIPPAVLTVVSFLLVSLALIAASDKNSFFVKAVWETSTSAKLLRIFLPTTIAVTVIESLIVIRILPHLNIHPAIGVSLVSLIVVAAVIVVISIISKSMGKSLDSALENLSENEARFRIFMNAHSDLTFIKDEHFRYLFADEQTARFFNRTPDELIGKTDEELVERAQISPCQSSDKRALESNEQFTITEQLGRHIFEVTKFSLQLPNNKKGIGGIMKDVTERLIVEKALKESEERFKLAMTAIKNGLFDWNLVTNEIYYSPGWKKMLGYEDDELPNDFTIRDKFTKPEDVEQAWKIQREVINKQRDRFEFEFKMKHKDGYWIDILSRAEAVFDENGKAIRMVGTHVDISERKHEEKIRAVELKLFEYAINHSEQELLQKFLDEAEELTGSEIGFYHYIEDDQESISLQTWSSNTLSKMCKGTGEATQHYPISKAGVWIDCIRERKAVIHNDYSSLAHKKGLPEGHAPIVRELVVPVIRGKQIMAVLGVGNKKSDYSETDVKNVQRLADIAWETIVRKQAEEKLKNIFDLSPSIISKANVQTGYFVEVNQAVTRILGYSVEEFTSTPLMDFIHLDDRQRTVDEILEQMNGNKTTSFENRYLCKDGSYKWMSWHSTKADKNGIVTVIGSDISERKIIEQEIVETKQFYKNITEAVQDGIWVTDKNDVIFYANSAAEKIAGVLLEQIYGKNILNEFPEETTGGLIKYYNQAKKEKKPIWYDIKVRTLANKDTWQNGWLIPQYQNNTFSGIICTVRDISERKQAESNIRKLSTAVKQSPSIILISDTEGKMEYVNPKFTEVTGYTSSEAIGQELNILKSGEQDSVFYKKMWKTVESGKVWRGQFHNKKKNGELFWEAASISAILNESGDVINYIKIGEDITQQKNTEAELKIALEKALESDRLKSAFLANMSHEIRTPMNGILGFINLLNEPDLSQSEIGEYSAIINQSGERLLNTINDIIDISKIEAGEVLISNSETSINNIMEELHSFFSPEANLKGLSLLMEPSLSYGQLRVITDSHKLHGVLTNLIKNAIKYTDRGHITFGYSVKEYFIEFYVKDTGIGIPKDRIKAIFNRFEQADIADTRVFEGSGLGLAISKAYAEMLGGDISVISDEGKGSTFTFTIPYNEKVKKHTEQVPENFDNDAKRIENLNLLIVEDDDISSKLLKTTLQGLFKEIIFVDNGKDAIETCRNNPELDLVLMDIKMPKMNGYDATTEIRKFNKEILIIAQTAYALRGDIEKAIAAGCDDYVSKPIKADELKQMITKYAKQGGASAKT